MQSKLWRQSPQEAYKRPYDYADQQLFESEAQSLLAAFVEIFKARNVCFTRSDRSLEKALWLLHFDALDALGDSLHLLVADRPHAAARLFRDVLETADLAEHFARGGQTAAQDLARWYDDEILTHAVARESAGIRLGSPAKAAMTALYRNLSKFTHRSYHAILQSYGVGANDMLWHDSVLRGSNLGSIPEIKAQYLAVLGSAIQMIAEHVLDYGVVDRAAISAAVSQLPHRAETMEDA